MTKSSFRVRNLVMALAVAAGTAGVMAGPALAADWDHRGPDPRARYEQRYQPHWRAQPHRVVYARPPIYVPAAPRYVYAPPPVAYGPPSLTFVLPLNFQ